jgi:hypothetical protein
LYSGNENKFRVNISSGTYYYTNSFFAGASFAKLLPDVTAVNQSINEQPSIFLLGGYKFFREKPNNIEQTIVLKRIGNEGFSVDGLTKFYVRQFNWIAVSYSSDGNIAALLGLHVIKKIYIGYKYEYTTGKIATYTSGSHQVSLGMNLGLIKVEDIRKLAK